MGTILIFKQVEGGSGDCLEKSSLLWCARHGWPPLIILLRMTRMLARGNAQSHLLGFATDDDAIAEAGEATACAGLEPG